MPARVAMITYDFYPFDVRVRRLAEAAADGGSEVDVICLQQEGELPFEVCNGVRTFRLPVGRGFGRSLPLTVLSWLRFLALAGVKVARLHRARPYDVIHVHNMPDFLVFAALMPKLAGARVILDVQDTSPELMAAKAHGRVARAVLRWLAAAQERVSAAFVDHVVTVGWPFEKLLLQRGIRPEKLSILLNSADPKIFPEARRSAAPNAASDPTRPFILMYWGTIAERNGLDTAIRALALAQPDVPNLRLDLMGRGEHIPALLRLAEELGVRDRVTLQPPCPAEEIVDFVVHGDLGIIPYRVDGFEELVLPTKAYELAWMGRPMLASNTVGIRSMFREQSIALCEPEHPEQFAAAIVDLYRHPEKRDHLIASAAEDYAAYRWERMAQRYRDLLAALTTPRRAATSPTASATPSSLRDRRTAR